MTDNSGASFNLGLNQFQKMGKAVQAGVEKAFRRWDELSHRTQIAIAFLVPVAIGVVLRLWHYFGARTLWIDEAYITLNFLERDIFGLLNPLDFKQIAPLGWLFLEKALLDTFGGLELTLRSPAIMAGLLSLIIFPLVAKRYLSVGGAVFAVIFFAFSDPLIRYSAEVKPYIVDVLFSVIVLWIGDELFRKDRLLKAIDFLALAVLGIIGVALSFPAAFLLAGLGGLLFLREVLAKRMKAAIAVSAISIVWLAEFAASILVLRKEQESTIQHMQSAGFDDTFAPFPPLSLDKLAWYPRTLVEYFDFLFEFQAIIFAFILVFVGIVAIFRKNLWVGCFVLAPIGIAVLASIFKAYPISGRLMLFAVPQVILLTALGITTIGKMIREPLMRRVAPIALSVFLLCSVGFATAKNFASFESPPYGDEHIRPALEYIANNREPGDAVYVYFAAYPAFNVYKNRMGLDDITVIQGSTPREGWNCYWRDIDRMQPHGRVWILFSHVTNFSGMDEVWGLRFFSQSYGDELFGKSFGMSSKFYGQAKLYLYDFSGEKGNRPKLPLNLPDNADEMCLRPGAIS